MKVQISNRIICSTVALFLVSAIPDKLCFSQSVTGGITRPSYKADPDVNERITFQTVPPDFDYNGVKCILKDHKGYMWFGTYDGLIRYDGVNLYAYENDQADTTSISHNSVNAIVEDKRNNLWVGTTIGLDLYNRELDNFTHVGGLNISINRLKNNYISTLCLDRKSRLWVGTFGDGVNVYDPENQQLTHYPYDSINPSAVGLDRVTCLIADSSGYVWIGTQNGLNMYSEETGEFIRFVTKPGNPLSLSNNNITSLTLDPGGNLWIGTRGGGINRLERANGNYLFRRYNSANRTGSLSNNFILSLLADGRHNLWIGTENGGLCRLKENSEEFDVFCVEEGNNSSLNSNSIWSLYCDDEDILWIGTSNQGVDVIDEKFNKFETYQKNIINRLSLTNDNVKGFSEDSKGNVWVATDGGGICRFNPVTRQFNLFVKNAGNQNYLANNEVQFILRDSKGNLWVGTWAGGVDLLNRNGIRIKNYRLESEVGGGNNNIQCLFEDSKGDIWAGTAGSGLFKLDVTADAFDQVSCRNEAGILTTSAYVTSMFEDSYGAFWVCTLYGMVIIQNESDREYSCINFSQAESSSGLSSNMIQCIYEDKKRRLWFGTGDYGLNLYNRQEGNFITFQKKDGLPSNVIQGILEDDEGYLWISTNKGLSRFNFDSLSYTNYTREDGLNSNEFYPRSCLRTRKGEFYFGGENGFNVFYPENIKKNSLIPPVYLTNLKINNVSAQIGVKGSPLRKCIEETNEITLSYKQNSFTLEFVALNYTRSSRNQYSYKLEGFDEDWNQAGNIRSASYTNIRPGRYIFLVKGSNNDGIWNITPTRLLITIKPPLWKTWWAILIYVILFSSLIGISLKIWKERINIKHQLRLEQLGREKEHELNEANIQFFTNISHEFRTPLSLIIAPLESIILSAQSKVKEQLEVIYRNAKRLLQLTNNLMDFRKMEEGIANLQIKHGDILRFVTEVSSYFNVESKQRRIDFTIETNESEFPGWFDPEKLETILLNLLSNAFKYTPDNGRIRIAVNYIDLKDIKKYYGTDLEKAGQDSRYVEFTVFDNGAGISKEELPFVFQKFYQTHASKKIIKKGTGIGLALTKGLVELHHGFIKAESIPYVETSFSFILPVERNAYSEDEVVSEPADTLGKTILGKPEGYPVQQNEEELSPAIQNKDKPEILIAEDNYELRTFLANELGKEYSVTQAENGKTGIDMALTEIPDLIVSDILMPTCSGIELCKTIKTDIRTCHIPVILLTAKTTIMEQIEGIQTGADAYITKPFNIQFLSAQINQLIESRKKLYAHFSQDVYIMPNKLTNNEMDQYFIQKTIDYIVLNIADNSLNVEGLSDALNLSRSNVYRKIKALTGKTIIEFIRIIRLKQAIKLMGTKKYSLSEIAYLTGFTSPSYFTKSFKDQYGKPPSEYLPQ